MQFDIKLSLDKEFEKNPNEYKGTRLASGWVEVENAFKFPIQILKKKNESNMFVKYPDVPDGNGEYSNIVFPTDEKLRESLNMAILNEMKNHLMKGLNNPSIDKVRVNVLKDEIHNGKITVKGFASIMIGGFAINGITIKAGEKGLFVQMPQRRDSSGQYQDMVYGTNALMQSQIKDAVLEKYTEEYQLLAKNREKELVQKLENNTPFVEQDKVPNM